MHEDHLAADGHNEHGRLVGQVEWSIAFHFSSFLLLRSPMESTRCYKPVVFSLSFAVPFCAWQIDWSGNLKTRTLRCCGIPIYRRRRRARPDQFTYNPDTFDADLEAFNRGHRTMLELPPDAALEFIRPDDAQES